MPEPWPCTVQWSSESSLTHLGGPPQVLKFSGAPAAFLFSPGFLSPDKSQPCSPESSAHLSLSLASDKAFSL